MSQFSHEIRNDIAWVTFDTGGMNTLSGTAIQQLRDKINEVLKVHASTPLKGVILKGNRFGLGAGADIGELLRASREQLARFIDEGHDVLFAIEEGPIPWLAVVDGFALGGMYEVALGCRGIIATEKSTVGLPEINLHIFPGLGGTQRLPRRSGLVNAEDPEKGAAGFSAILQGKNFKAKAAAAIKMIDAVVPAGEDLDSFAEKFLTETLPGIDRTPPTHLADAESLRETILPVVQKSTRGRPNPRAPYVAVDVMIKGASLPLRDAIKVERDAFIDVAASPEGKAGMRFFFTQQKVQKVPKPAASNGLQLKKIGIDGIDGFMGNAIGWLALEAGYEVVGHVPLEKFAASVAPKLAKKYSRAVQSGKMSEADVEQKVASVQVTTDIKDLFDCDLVIEARMENREVKADFFRKLGAGIKKTALVASNSSSMGPGLLGGDLAAGGGDPKNFVNLHFFSPAEHPAMQLVEVVVQKDTSPDVVDALRAFVRSIKKTPVVLQDGSAGFLVNAGLGAYFLAAEALYCEGTPIEAIDAAMRKHIFPVGPFELSDQAGNDVLAGMFEVINEATPLGVEPLAWKLREQERFGAKSGAGFYDYENRKKTGVWPGLAGLVPNRGSRAASEEEIVERCARALYNKARDLCDRKIVSSEDQCDLAFIFGLGFANYLGGPIFYAQQQGWDKGGLDP